MCDFSQVLMPNRVRYEARRRRSEMSVECMASTLESSYPSSHSLWPISISIFRSFSGERTRFQRLTGSNVPPCHSVPNEVLGTPTEPIATRRMRS